MNRLFLQALVVFFALFAFASTQSAEAAMCGTAPWNTAESYWCSNYCHSTPPATSCSAWCCGWAADDTWQQISCSASGSPCVWNVCGDGVCTSETGEGSYNCPQDCGYVSDGGGPTYDSCVVDVVKAVIDASQHSPDDYFIGRDLYNTDNYVICGNLFLPPYDYSCLIPQIIPGASICHIQGVTRIRNTPYLLFVGNTSGEGGFANDCNDAAQDDLEAMGLLGSHMFLAYDTNYASSQPRLWPPGQRRLGRGGGQSSGLQRRPSGRYPVQRRLRGGGRGQSERHRQHLHLPRLLDHGARAGPLVHRRYQGPDGGPRPRPRWRLHSDRRLPEFQARRFLSLYYPDHRRALRAVQHLETVRRRHRTRATSRAGSTSTIRASTWCESAARRGCSWSPPGART